MAEKDKCCQDCAGNGKIKDFTGEKFVMCRPCRTCFGTGMPYWMLNDIINGDGAHEPATTGWAEFLKRWKGRNDGTQGTDGAAPAGADTTPHGGEQDQVPPGRPGVGSPGGGSSGSRQEPQDRRDGNPPDAGPGDPPQSVRIAAMQIVREWGWLKLFKQEITENPLFRDDIRKHIERVEKVT